MKVQEGLKTALKGKDEVSLRTFRMLLAAIQTVEAGKKKGSSLDESEEIALLRRAIAQRKEAAEQYRSGGREESAVQEESEIKVISAFMPEEMGDEQIRSLVMEAIAEVGATSPKDMGKLMKALMPKIAGKAEGGRVKNIAASLLS